MKMTENDLLKLKEKVDEAKTTVSELRGELTAGMKQLKDDWKLPTIDAAKKKLKTIASDIESLEIQINEHAEELETKFDLQ